MPKILLSTLIAALFTLLACVGGDKVPVSPKPSTGDSPARVSFYNESSYKVDIYKNLNPESFDPSAFVCSVEPGQTAQVELYASSDNIIGDVFFIRYKILLADRFETGSSDIFVDAERTLSNITSVVELGKTYSHTIPQPSAGGLKFVNGYISVLNAGSTQIRVQRANTVLLTLGDRANILAPSQHGYYEIPIPYFDDALTMDMLQAFNTDYIDFPTTIIERGKLYKFTVGSTGVGAPVVSNINPIGG